MFSFFQKIAASQPDASTASGNAPGKEANGHGHGPVKASSASRIALPSGKTREVSSFYTSRKIYWMKEYGQFQYCRKLF